MMSEYSAKYTRSDEDRRLLTHMEDLVREAFSKNKYTFSDFLTPAEQALAASVIEFRRDCEISFEGGYSQATRKVAVIAPKGCGYTEEPPISILTINYKGDRLSNRDLLGAAMSLGIKRQTIGDIADSAEPPFLVCTNKMRDYLIAEFKSAARTKITLMEGEAGQMHESEFEEKTATVASLRLDSVTAECFGLSRSAAAELIKRGTVTHNYLPCTEQSKQISERDVITARGYGKAELSECGGISKKGRIFVKIRRYK